MNISTRTRWTPTTGLTMLGLALLLGFGVCQAYAGDVIEITSIEQLQKIGNDPDYPLDGAYVLTQDVDAAETAGWNEGAGFDPIGKPRSHFTGTFDGQGHIITGLFIDRRSEDFVGLFGYVDGPGEVKNLGLEDVDVTGRYEVGGLVGYLDGGTVSNCHVTGAVEGNNNSVGGLVGYSWSGDVVESYSSAGVTGNSSVGGLLGNQNGGEVSESYATGAVMGFAGIGGLVGSSNRGTVSKSYATGAVTASGSFAGGLVGNSDRCTMSDSYATGAVTAGGSYAGGLVGYSHYETTVSDSYATGAVTAGGSWVGGLVGYNSHFSTVSASYATGMVSGDSAVGGLVGINVNSTVNDSFWDVQTSLTTESDGGVGLSTADMQTQDTFTDAGWDFVDIWHIPAANSYPHLLNVPESELPSLPGVPGDVNGDGEVNAIDIQLVINHVLGIPIDPAYTPDVNADGAVNALDIQLVINIVLGIQ